MTAQTRDRFNTLADAQSALNGTADWDWGGVASWDGWAEYAYRHAVEAWNEDEFRWVWDHDACLREYLQRVGVDPSEFQL